MDLICLRHWRIVPAMEHTSTPVELPPDCPTCDGYLVPDHYCPALIVVAPPPPPAVEPSIEAGR